MKKTVLILAAIIMAMICLPACVNSHDPNAITILGKKSDLEKTYMTRIFDLYKQSGKNINIVSVEDEKFENYAEKQFSKGKIPDIFMHFHNSDLNRFNVYENFMDLSGEPWVGDLTESAANYCTDDRGNLLGLPFWESSVSGCYYNKTIFDELGLRAVTTQRGFNNLCSAVKEQGYTPICWPANGCAWMPQFGLDPVFADDPELLAKLNANEIKYADIPEVRNMVSWLYDGAQNGRFGTDYLKTGWDDISEQLASGKAVMTFIWDTWFTTDFKPGKYTADDFELMPVFMNTAEKGTYEGGNLNMMMVNKNSGKLSEALNFLSFCATPENYNKAFEGIATISCFKGMTTNVQSGMVTKAKDSIAELERVSTASTRIIGYSEDEVAGALNELFRGNISVDECLALMDSRRMEKAARQGAAGF